MMAQRLPLPIQTMYAELVERCSMDRLIADFPITGSFFTKVTNGRSYWYFRSGSDEQGKRGDRYVGPDSPDLQRQIENHRQAKASFRERRMMLTSLQRAGLRGPDSRTGRILEALADAGVFRLRAVVVGTAAYQAYSGLLGVLLANRNAMTDDLDLAQFPSISIAVGDQVQLPFGDILRKVDPRFEAVPHQIDGRRATHYTIGNEFRVDILAPNRGPDDETPVTLPALQVEAQPLRFLDFLIYQEVQAVALYGGGIAINVPAPERYALHKLLVSRMRIKTEQSQAKALKDLRQAGELIDVLVVQRPYELQDLWNEMRERGPKWRRMTDEAVGLLDWATGTPMIRQRFLSTVGANDEQASPTDEENAAQDDAPGSSGMEP
jgi:hypothetical protein